VSDDGITYGPEEPEMQAAHLAAHNALVDIDTTPYLVRIPLTSDGKPATDGGFEA